VALGPAGAERRLYKNSGDYDVRVRFNRHGLRDQRDIADARPDDVVFVGDSFTFGWGVGDYGTGKRRPFLRFYACEEDLSHEPAETCLPDAVLRGEEPFLIIGSIAGG
jgi:hypothetical protein